MAQQQSIKVFDEYVPAGSGTVYSSDRFNQVMGSLDEITLFAVVDDVSGSSGTFDCWIEMSADGRLWLQRNDVSQSCPPPENPAGVPGDMHIGTLATTTVNASTYSDACLGLTKGSVSYAGPMLAFVRLAVQVGTVGAQVRIHYLGRGHRA